MNFSDYKAIAFRRDGKVLHATFNRPDTLNAVDPDLDADLQRLFKDVSGDPETNVLVLTGAGRAFSAGGNIDHMQKVIDHPEIFFDDMINARQLVFSLLDCVKPVIAKINGPAMGLGATIALFCDLAIATHKAKIADPHVSVGFVAGDGGAVIWPQLIGYMRAKEYLLTGDAITGEEAAKIGLINRSVAPEELDAAVDQFAQRIANGPSRAIQWTKQSVNIRLKNVAHSIMDASIALEALSNITKDHQEAVAAFREKRKPTFTGS